MSTVSFQHYLVDYRVRDAATGLNVPHSTIVVAPDGARTALLANYRPLSMPVGDLVITQVLTLQSKH